MTRCYMPLLGSLLLVLLLPAFVHLDGPSPQHLHGLGLAPDERETPRKPATTRFSSAGSPKALLIPLPAGADIA